MKKLHNSTENSQPENCTVSILAYIGLWAGYNETWFP